MVASAYGIRVGDRLARLYELHGPPAVRRSSAVLEYELLAVVISSKNRVEYLLGLQLELDDIVIAGRGDEFSALRLPSPRHLFPLDLCGIPRTHDLCYAVGYEWGPEGDGVCATLPRVPPQLPGRDAKCYGQASQPGGSFDLRCLENSG